MKKIFDLEMKLASTTIGQQKKQIQKEISKLISLRDNALEKSQPATPFGKRLSRDTSIEKLPEPTEVGSPKFSNSFIPSLTKKEKTTFNKNKIFKNKGSNKSKREEDKTELRKNIEANMMNASENQGLGGTSPTDVNMNVLERLVSKVIGKNVRFEDIPDDDPEFDVGYKSEGHFAHPAGRPDLRKGGITQKQRARIKSIVGQYNQKKKAKKTNGKRTNR